MAPTHVQSKDDQERARDQIVKGSREGRKTYAFDELHNSEIPAQWWFQHSSEGLVLFIVFYTQACRWSRCLACNLPSKCSEFHVTFSSIMQQVNYVFDLPEVQQQKNRIRKVIVSNNGSVLDEATFSSAAFIYFMAKVNIHFPELEVVSIETRPEYVDEAELEFISRTIEEGKTPTTCEIAIGMEAFDDHIRDGILMKGLDLKKVDNMCALMKPYGFQLKVYVMQKPVPGMSNAEAVEDVKKCIEYLHGISERHGIQVNMHLNPTYVSVGTDLEKAFRLGQYSPPNLDDVVEAVMHAKGRDGLSVFVGLSDEGLAVPGGEVVGKDDSKIVDRINKFNATQLFDSLRA